MKKKTTPKKSPADYPQMIFRISQDDKDRISKLVEKVTRLHNKNLLPHMKKIRKNDVIVDALFYGLLRSEKGLGKHWNLPAALLAGIPIFYTGVTLALARQGYIDPLLFLGFR